jgi:hypothetical protein
LGLSRVAGLVKHFGIDPADHRAAATQPKRVVFVVAELQVMSSTTTASHSDSTIFD